MNIYLATESAKLACMTRWTAYVMECEIRGEARTKETFAQRTGTYHTVCLQMIAEALGRMKEKCEIHISCPDVYVANMMGSLEGIAANGFRTKGGELIKNHFDWRAIYERMQGHLITVESGRNQYSEWMRAQMELRADDREGGSNNKTGTNDNKLQQIITKKGGTNVNKVILMGRLTRDPDVRYSPGEGSMAYARYTLAVDRRGRRDNNNQQTADFISCVTFGKGAEFAEKYLRQGTKIVITGRIQTGSYTNRDGQKVYTTDVVVEEHEFAESKASQRTNGSGNGRGTGGTAPQTDSGNDSFRQESFTDADGFMNIPDGIDEELPFA